MTRTISRTSAGLAGLAAGAIALGAVPARAGDWNNGAGTLKDRGSSAVPVPAPIASPDTPSGWYVRVDGTVGSDTNFNARQKGLVVGAGNLNESFSTSGAGFNPSLSRSGDSLPTIFSGGIGIGYNWGHNWRSDVTVDRRSTINYQLRGSYQYLNNVTNPNYAAGNPTATTPYISPTLLAPPAPASRIDGTVNDETTIKSGVLLANTYYDWKNRSLFTPFIGAGVGIAYFDVRRKQSTSDTSCDPDQVPQSCFTRTPHAGFSAERDDSQILFAAAAHAGFSYELTSSTSLDVGYRFLYIPSTGLDLKVNGSQSRVTLSDTTEHQLRAGLRWNIN